MKYFIKIFLFCFCFIQLIEQQTNAQLYGIGYDYKVTVNSALNDGKDTVYAFNATDRLPKKDLYTRRGELIANSPDSTLGWTFVWSQYDYFQKIFVKFDSLVMSGSNSESRSNLVSGGYQVRMIKDSIDTTFRAWIFINKLRFHLRKTSDGKVSPFYSQCAYVKLGVIKAGEPAADTSLTYIHNDFYYANPVPGRANLVFRNDTNILWSSVPDAGTLDKEPQIYKYAPPTDTTIFSVSFSDTFGNNAADTVIYDPIRTIADFDYFTFQDSIFHRLKDSTKAFINDTSAIGEAPLLVKFKNKSKNGYNFQWFLADSFHRYFDTRQIDFYLSSNPKDSVSYTYYRPYIYTVKLYSTGPYNICTDSVLKKVTVDQSQLGPLGDSSSLRFPNAFEPGNKYYGFFTFKEDTTPSHNTNYKSIRIFHLTIYNQWGKWMWEYLGSGSSSDWKGWDGTTKYNYDAPAGVYYYFYDAIGWGPFATGTSSSNQSSSSTQGPMELKGGGFFYLFRNKK